MDGNKKYLSGCEKRKRDAAKKLDIAGKDPKESKLDFLRQKGKAGQKSTYCLLLKPLQVISVVAVIMKKPTRKIPKFQL